MTTTGGTLNRDILRLAVPALGALVAEPLFLIVDSALVGHLGVTPLAGLGIASAVLHFAADDQHFAALLRGAWRVLAPRGLLFCRLASSIGIADRVRPIGNGRYRLPDGSDRYLVDEAALLAWTAALGGDLADPIKTTVVQDQRAMTTWVVRKR